MPNRPFRNAPCPCGSGKKYKDCCRRLTAGSVAGTAKQAGALPHRLHREHAELVLVERLRKAGVDPALIYAIEQTSQVITSENEDQFSRADVERFNQAIDEHRARTTRLTTDELLTCDITTFVDLVTELNARQCEQHVRTIVDRLQGVDFETYAKALLSVALFGPVEAPSALDQYLLKTRELFPGVPMDDDVLERLVTLMLFMMNRRLARDTNPHAPLLP